MKLSLSVISHLCQWSGNNCWTALPYVNAALLPLSLRGSRCFWIIAYFWNVVDWNYSLTRGFGFYEGNEVGWSSSTINRVTSRDLRGGQAPSYATPFRFGRGIVWEEIDGGARFSRLSCKLAPRCIASLATFDRGFRSLGHDVVLESENRILVFFASNLFLPIKWRSFFFSQRTELFYSSGIIPDECSNNCII